MIGAHQVFAVKIFLWELGTFRFKQPLQSPIPNSKVRTMLGGIFFTVYTWPLIYLTSTVYNSLRDDLMALARGHFQDSSTCGRFVQLSLQLLSNSASNQPLASCWHCTRAQPSCPSWWLPGNHWGRHELIKNYLILSPMIIIGLPLQRGGGWYS